MLCFLTEHTLIIYVQYIKGYKRKTPYLFEKLFEKDLVHFVSDSIFKRLKFDYSSSETVSNQKMKTKNWFFDDSVFLKIRLTHGNQLLAHLSQRLMGELIVYQSLRRPSVRPSVVRPSVRLSTFSNIFSSETTGPIKLKFHMETP